MYPLIEHGYTTSGGVVFISNIGDMKAKVYFIGVTFTIVQGNNTGITTLGEVSWFGETSAGNFGRVIIKDSSTGVI